MNTEPHPQVAKALAELQRFNKALEDQMNQTNSQSFTATDEAETVEVTIDGHRGLSALHIEDGLLRLGAETVEQRINEALVNVQAAASEAIKAQQMQLFASISEIAGSLQNSVGAM